MFVTRLTNERKIKYLKLIKYLLRDEKKTKSDYPRILKLVLILKMRGRIFICPGNLWVDSK